MAGKLYETAKLKGGEILDCSIVGGTTVDVTETVARAPSVYRALAVAGGNTYHTTVTIARATVGAKGAATIGRLRIEAPVDTAYPIVQKFTGTDGVESKRVSSSESVWGSWRKIFDEVDKPSLASGDVTGAGTAATQNTGATGSAIPKLDGSNEWGGAQTFLLRALMDGFFCISTPDVVAIAAGVATLTATYNKLQPQSGSADDLDTITATNGVQGDVVVLTPAASTVITIKHGTGNIHCGADIVLTSTGADDFDIATFVRGGSGNWHCRSFRDNTP